MIHELTVYKLGKLLSELSSEYNVSLLVKRKLSGGFITVTGIKDTLFKVEVVPTKFKEINIGGLSIDKIQESKEECKVKVDEDLIFTVPAPSEVVEKLI